MATEPREAQQDSELVGEVSKRLTRLGWLASAAGTVVVFMAVGFLIPIFLDPGQRTELALLNAPLAAVTVVVVGLLMSRISA